MRNSASINLGISLSGVSAGSSSSWQYVTTVEKYWENTNGADNSWYRFNMAVSPSINYRSNTIAIHNAATLELDNNVMVYYITASV